MNLSRLDLHPICEFYIFTLFLITMTAMLIQIFQEFYLLFSAH